MPRLVARSEILAWEERLRAGLLSAASRQQATLRAALRAHGLSMSSPISEVPAAVWDRYAWAEAVRDEVEPVAREVAESVLSTASSRLPARLLWGAPRPIDALSLMVTGPALAAGQVLADRISTGGLTAAMTPAQIARALEEAPERYGGIVHPESIQTVEDAYAAAIGNLNTLVDRVANQMSNAAQAVLSSTVDRNQKEPVMNIWTTVGDDRVRDDHLFAEGQEQRPGEPFDVGGESLLYPGDPDGSDENVMNCRCWIESTGGAMDEVEGTGDEFSDLDISA